MDINDYKTLEPRLNLEPVEVGWHIWRPTPFYVQPFVGWFANTPPLGWYGDYNQVKHNRNARFPLANLSNARLALSGVFAVLGRLKLLPNNLPGHRYRDLGRQIDIHYVPYPQLSLRIPN